MTDTETGVQLDRAVDSLIVGSALKCPENLLLSVFGAQFFHLFEQLGVRLDKSVQGQFVTGFFRDHAASRSNKTARMGGPLSGGIRILASSPGDEKCCTHA